MPALKAPLDLKPKTATVNLRVPRTANLAGATIIVEPSRATLEITRRNNAVPLSVPDRQP